MKKYIICTFILFGLIFLFINRPELELRVRIIPNSNEYHDIVVKYEVIDLIQIFLKENIAEDKNNFISNIKENLTDLKVEVSLVESNYTIKFVNHNFYNKTYNTNVLRNESHLTLLVKLNEANGSNWWASVYPDFLGISGSDEIVFYSLLKRFFNWMRR